MASPERPVPTRHGDRDVYSVASFNQGLSSWIGRLPHVWVEGEVTELRRQPGWAFAFWTLKDLLSLGLPQREGDAAVELLDLHGVRTFHRCSPVSAGATSDPGRSGVPPDPRATTL